MTFRRRVSVLGSTGSVGVSTLDLMERAQEHGSGQFEVVALTAGRNLELLGKQARRWRPETGVLTDESRKAELESALVGLGVEVAVGQSAVEEAAARPADWVMASI